MRLFSLLLNLVIGAGFGWTVSTYVVEPLVAASMFCGGFLLALGWLAWENRRLVRQGEELLDELRQRDGRRR